MFIATKDAITNATPPAAIDNPICFGIFRLPEFELLVKCVAELH
jgi:hypothetical protein